MNSHRPIPQYAPQTFPFRAVKYQSNPTEKQSIEIERYE